MNVTHRLQAVIAASILVAACGVVTTPVETIDPWPLTVDRITLSCEPAAIPESADPAAASVLRSNGGRVFATTPDGRRFAVNGTARSEAASIEEIQAQLDIQPLIQRGLALCEQNSSHTLDLAARKINPSTPQVTSPPRASIEASPLRGHHYTMESDELIANQRARLTFACREGRAPMLMLDLVQSPRTAPPLRGVYANIGVGAGQPRPYEMSWATESDWTLRSGDSRSADSELARSIAESGEIAFEGSGRYMPAQQLTFRFTFTPNERADFNRECQR